MNALHPIYVGYIRIIRASRLYNLIIIDRVVQLLQILTKYSIPKHSWVIKACIIPSEMHQCEIEWRGNNTSNDDMYWITINSKSVDIGRIRSCGRMNNFETCDDEILLDMDDIIHNKVFKMHFM